MLRKLKALGDDLFKWKIYVRFPDRQLMRHVTATKHGAAAIYAELLDQAARAKMGLKHHAPEHVVDGPAALGPSAAGFERELMAEGLNAEHVAAVGRTLADFRRMKGDTFPIARITRADLVAWREWRLKTPKVTKFHKGKPPSARTVNKERAHLARFLEWCVTEGLRPDNPARGFARVKAPEPPTKVVAWSDFGMVTDWCWKKKPEAALFLEVLGETGARFNEVASAKAGDVDRKRKIWTGVHKGKRTVELPAFRWTLEAAKRAKDSAAPLCPDPKGRPWPYSWLRSILRQACTETGVTPFSPHAVRHGRSTWDVEAGLDPRTVQLLRGHKQLSTTERYFKTARISEAAKAKPVKKRPLKKPPKARRKGRKKGRESV